MSFTAPLNLIWSLLIVAGLAYVYRLVERRSEKYARAYTHLPFLESIVGPGSRWDRAIFIALMSGIVLMGIAWAGPHLTLRLPLSDGTVVVCVDTSGSMASADVDPTRAQAAVTAIHRFVRELGPTVKVGLISFATDAQVVTQPTADRQVLADAIDTLPRPNGATAIGDALALAGEIMPKSGRRAVILITDGVNNRGADPLESAHDLGAAHIPVYTVGIGTNGSGQLVPGTSEQASSDPQALQEYAQITGGTATMAADAGAIIKAFAELARSSIWETQRVDASVITALCGGLSLIAAFFMAFALGKLP